MQGEAGNYMVTQNDLTLASGHTMRYTDVSQNCTLDTYIILLPNGTAMTYRKEKPIERLRMKKLKSEINGKKFQNIFCTLI